MRPRLSIALLLCCVVGIGAAADASSETAAQPKSAALGPWIVRVSVRPARLGPLSVRISHVQARGRGSKRVLSADLTFRNGAKQTAEMTDKYRTSAFAEGGTGDQLLVADEGCGYAVDKPQGPVIPGVCQAYLDSVVMKPGRVGVRTITAQRGLRGMTPLSEGHYTFARQIDFRFDKGDQAPVRADLVVSFDVARG